MLPTLGLLIALGVFEWVLVVVMKRASYSKSAFWFVIIVYSLVYLYLVCAMLGIES